MTISKGNCRHVGPSTAILFGLASLGLLRALSATTGAVRFIWRKHLRRGKKLRNYGEWALVTGASDGIGRAYCDYLAKQGLNIFLVSRTKSKLEVAQAEIAERYGVESKILVVDLAEAGHQPLSAPVWADLKTIIDAIDIGVLINNAGKVQGPPAEFHEIDPESLDSTVSLNNVAALKVSHLVLPGMVKRGRGAVVNVSSFFSAIPAAPLISLYAASKGFLDTWTKALAAEYGPKGIDVQVQQPGPVYTSMSPAVCPQNVFIPNPAKFVAHAGRHIGHETVCNSYPLHAVSMGITKLLPAAMVTCGIKWAMGQWKAEEEAQAAESAALAENSGAEN